MEITPLFPFGHGLSYTKFEYDNLEVAKSDDNTVQLKYSIKNIGEIEGSEISQVYISFPKESNEPPKQLKGFEKTNLTPNEKKIVSIEIPPKGFSIWDEIQHKWSIVSGEYKILVGSSSRDIRLSASVHF